MAVRALLGMETEYAVTGITRDGASVDRGQLVGWMLAHARASCPHLRDGGSGLFLANGARLYMDRGCHPEFATPECGDPWEVVRYVRAGEALLLDLARRVQRENRELRELALFRCNVDYNRSGVTWGCHESYLHSRNPLELPAQLLPHLVTRVIYAGAGGFNPTAPGAQFTLSPRAWLLRSATSGDSTSERAIVHLKDESLARSGWHRLHLICGESLCSDTAAVLKLGTTALVLAAVDAGRRPGDAVRLADPVHALRTIAADPPPDRPAGVTLEAGGHLSASEIQRHYLAEVEACDAGRLPEWAGELCRLWRAQLDALDARAPSLERTLDWAIKRLLYQRWVRDRMSWRALQRAGALLARLERTTAQLCAKDQMALRLDGALRGRSPLRFELSRLAPLLAAENLTWEDLRGALRLCNELLEADTRFGQLGEAGVFEQLDRAGLLTHRAPPPPSRGEPRADPQSHPPAGGRARIRGDWIRRLWNDGAAGRYRGDWTALWDETTGRSLDLTDPFGAAAEWR